MPQQQLFQRSVKSDLAAALIRRQPAGSDGDQSAANLPPLTESGSTATPKADRRTFRQPTIFETWTSTLRRDRRAHFYFAVCAQFYFIRPRTCCLTDVEVFPTNRD